MQAQFPSLSDEIREAGMCLALGRSTAGAFHLLRCLEAVLRAVSRCLRIPDPVKAGDRNWGKALTGIEAEIDRRWPKSSRTSGDGVQMEKLHTSLAAMKNPYRNATMHLEIKYTESEARHLMEITRGIMESVAARMDENGQPLA